MENKLISTINLFRQQGFFSTFEGDSSKIAEKIISTSESSYFGNIINLENEPLFEQIVLSYDNNISWFIEDVNAYEISDEVRPEMYVEVFKHLKKISKGLFIPENIETQECGYCEGSDKRIIVRYNTNDIETELVFCADGWALMLNFLEEINESILQTSHSFEYVIDSYGVCFIFFLNSSQKKFLAERKNWSFILTPRYWTDKALYFKEKNIPFKAQECFQKAIIKGNDINTLVQYGVFLRDEKRFAEAVEIFDLGIQKLADEKCQFNNPQWWIDLINQQIKGIKNQQ